MLELTKSDYIIQIWLCTNIILGLLNIPEGQQEMNLA